MREIPVDLFVRAPASPAVRIIAAGTGIERTDQHEIRRIRIGAAGSCDSYIAILQRLPHDIERRMRKFRDLVQKEHAPVRKRYRTRLRDMSAAGERCLRNRMMRCDKGSFGNQCLSRLHQACHRIDRRYLQRLFLRQIRQDRRDSLGDHALSGPRCPDHQQMMKSCRGDLHRTPDRTLSVDVAEILFGFCACFLKQRRAVHGEGREQTVSLPLIHRLQIGDRLRKRPYAHDTHAVNDGSLPDAFGGQKAGLIPFFPRLFDDGQYPCDPFDLPVETEFADDQRLTQGIRIDLSERRENPECDRQIDADALLADVRRRKINGDVFGRQLDPRIAQGDPDAFRGFAYLRGQQTYHVKHWKAVGDVRFDLHQIAGDPADRTGCDCTEHDVFFPLSEKCDDCFR